MATPHCTDLAASVRLARESVHLTQAELATRAGVSMQTVSRIERGLSAAEDSVRAVAAALNVDAAMLPRRPTRSAMPGKGETDPHWREFLAAVAEAGEKVIASERTDLGRYDTQAAMSEPRVETLLDGEVVPVAWLLLGFVGWTLLTGLTCIAAAVAGIEADDTAQDTIMLLAAIPAVTFMVAGFRAWARNAPRRAHGTAAGNMAESLRGERYVVTDRAAYVARRSEVGTYAWRRMPLPAPLSSRSPIDAMAPEVTSLTLGDAAGNTLTLLAPVPGGTVETALAKVGTGEEAEAA